MKTAVELLVEQVFGKNTNYYLQWKLEIDQALAMEKEQIDDAYDSGWYDGSQEDPENRVYKDYYEENFKSDGKV
jgi:hypothetical protein